MTGFQHVRDDLIHTGPIWRFVTATCSAPDGSAFQRDVVRSNGAVGVVPLVYDEHGEPCVVLVAQYRAPFDDFIIEIPAGMRDVAGEATEQTGRRELAEEVGLLAGSMTHLLDSIPSPGMTDSKCAIFLATDCTSVPRDLHGPEENHMQLLQIPLRETLAMIDRGEISDSKTVAGLFMTDRHLRRSSSTD